MTIVDRRRRGAGLGVTAVGIVGMALGPFLPTAVATGGLPALCRVAIAGWVLVAIGVGARLVRSRRPESHPTQEHRRRVARRESILTLAWTSVVVAIVIGVYAVLDIRGGMPGPAITVIALGAVATAAGLFTLAAPAVAHPAPTSRTGGLAVAATAMVVTCAIGVGATILFIDHLPVRADTGAADPAPDRFEGLPTEVAWTSGPFDDVIAAGPGAVLRHRDTVRGIDGVDGSQRWSYARPGAHVAEIASTPDESVVVATFATSGRGDDPEVLVETLDALTGEQLASRRGPAPGSDDRLADAAEPAIRTTDHSRLFLDAELDDDGERLNTGTLRATSLPGIEDAWTWTTPATCTLTAPSFGPDDAWAAYADVVVVSLSCGEAPDTHVLLGLDAAQGTERWRVEQEVATDGVRAYDIFVPARGGVFASAVPDGTDRVLVRDPADGSVVGELPDTDQLYRRAPDGSLEVVARVDSEDADHDQRLVVVDPETGDRRELATLGTGAGDTYLWSGRTASGWVGPGRSGHLGVAPADDFDDWYEVPADLGGAFGGSYPRVLEPTPGRVLVAAGAVLAVPDCRSSDNCHVAGLR